jgi:hypothetical protein
MYRVLINRPDMPVSRVIVKDSIEFTRLVELILTLEEGRPIKLNGAYTAEELESGFDRETFFSYNDIVFRVKVLNGKP